MYAPREKPSYSDGFPSRMWVPVQTSSSGQRPNVPYDSTALGNARPASKRASDDERHGHHATRPLRSYREEILMYGEEHPGDIPGSARLHHHSRPSADRHGRAVSWRPKPNDSSTNIAAAPSLRREFEAYHKSTRSSRDERIARGRTPATQLQQGSPASRNADGVPAWRLLPPEYQVAGDAGERRFTREGCAISESAVAELQRRSQHNPAQYLSSSSWRQCAPNKSRNDGWRAAPRADNVVSASAVTRRARPSDDDLKGESSSRDGRDDYRHRSPHPQCSRQFWIPGHQTPTSRHSYGVNSPWESRRAYPAGSDKWDMRSPRNNYVEYQYQHSRQYQRGRHPDTARQVAAPPRNRDITRSPRESRFRSEVRDYAGTPERQSARASYASAVADMEISVSVGVLRHSTTGITQRLATVPVTTPRNESFQGAYSARLPYPQGASNIPADVPVVVAPLGASTAVGATSSSTGVAPQRVSTAPVTTPRDEPFQNAYAAGLPYDNGTSTIRVDPSAVVMPLGAGSSVGAARSSTRVIPQGVATARVTTPRSEPFQGACSASLPYQHGASNIVYELLGVVPPSVPKRANNVATWLRRATAGAILETPERAGGPAAPYEKPLRAPTATRPKPADGTGPLQNAGPFITTTSPYSAKSEAFAKVSSPSASSKAYNTAAPSTLATAVGLSKVTASAQPPDACRASGHRKATAPGAPHKRTEPHIIHNLAAPPKEASVVGILKLSRGAHSGQVSGNGILSKVARGTPVKVVTFATPLEAYTKKSRPRKAAKNTPLSKDIRRPSRPQGGRFAEDKKTTVAASVKVVRGPLRRKVPSGARPSKTGDRNASTHGTVTTDAARSKTPASASATTASARKRSCVSRSIRSEQAKKIIKGKQKQPPPSSSSSSSSSSDSDSSDSDSSDSDSSDSDSSESDSSESDSSESSLPSSPSSDSSTSSCSTSDSDLHSERPSAGRNSSSGSSVASSTRRCSRMIRQPAKTQGRVSSTFRGKKISAAQQETSCLRDRLSHRKKDVSSSVGPPAVATQAVKPKKPLPKMGTPVITKSIHENLPHKSCKSLSEAKNIQAGGGGSSQTGQNSTATTVDAENNKSSSPPVIAASAINKSTSRSAEQALLCPSAESGALQSVSQHDASLRQNKSESSVRQGGKIPSNSKGNSGSTGITPEGATEQLTREALPCESTLADRTFEPVETRSPPCNTTADKAQPVDAGAGALNANQDCKQVTTTDKAQSRGAEAVAPKGSQHCEHVATTNKVQPVDAEAAPPKGNQDCEHVAATHKVQTLGAEAASPKWNQDCGHVATTAKVQPVDAGAGALKANHDCKQVTTTDKAQPRGAEAVEPKGSQHCEHASTTNKVQPVDAEAVPPKCNQNCEHVAATDKVQPVTVEAVSPKGTQDCEYVTTTHQAQLVDAQAAPPKGNQDCERVPNRNPSNRHTATHPSCLKKEQNSNVAGSPTVKVKKRCGAATSPRKRRTRHADLISSDNVGTSQAQSAFPDLEVGVKSTVNTTSGSRATKAGRHRAASAPKSSLSPAATVPPTGKDALAPPAVSTAGTPGACKIASSGELGVNVPACTSATSSTFATAQPADSITPAPVRAAQRNPVTNSSSDSARCAPTIIDGPCACELTPAGLANLGKTCGINALLQALSATRVFSKFCNDVYHREMNAISVVDSTTTARTLGPDNAAAAMDQPKEMKISTALLTPIESEGNAAPHCIEDEDPRSTCRKELALSRSLAAILYQMCNGTRLNNNAGEKADTTRETPSEASATDQQQELQNARKQLRVLKQLRAKKWGEEQGGRVLTPIAFVRQLEMLNAEIQYETELDVEEIWRCIADRLLQEANDECRRLTLMLEDASSHLKQRPESEAGSLCGSGDRQDLEVATSSSQEKCRNKEGYSLTGNRAGSSSQPRCPGNAPEECASGEVPALSSRHSTGDANSSNFAGESGRDCLAEIGLPSPALVSNDGRQQAQRGTTDKYPVRAGSGEKTASNLDGDLQQAGQKAQTPQGPEKPQGTVAVDGATLCIVDVKNSSSMTLQEPTTDTHLGKPSDKPQEDENAGVTQEGVQARTADSSPGRCVRLKKRGQYESEQGGTRRESPCTPPDTSRTKRFPEKVERNCLPATGALCCASSSPQLTSFNEQSQKCLLAERQKLQIPTDLIASSLRAAQGLQRRLQNTLSGRLVHVPVACKCCCSCNSVTLPVANIPNPQISVSLESGKVPSAIPSLLRTSFPGTSSSTLDQKSSPSLCKTSYSSCPRDSCASGLGCLLDQGGLKGGNEGSGESGISRRGTSETSNGILASHASTGSNSDSQSTDVCAKERLTCDEAVTEGQSSGKKKSHLQNPPKENESEFETNVRHRMPEPGVGETMCASLVVEHAAAATAAESVRGTAAVTGMSSVSHPLQGQSVSESPRGDTSRIYACNNQSETSNRAASNGAAARLRSDMHTHTQQSVKEGCQRPDDMRLATTGSFTAPHDHVVMTPPTRCPHPSDSQVVSCVSTAAPGATSGFLLASSSTDISTSTTSRTEPVANLSSALNPPAAETKSLVPCSSAVKAQEELFSAAVLPLRLPERSRWAARRPQGARNRMQPGTAQLAGSPAGAKQDPITLEECLNLGMEDTCNGECVVIAAQKTAARSRKGRAPGTEVKGAQQASCKQRGSKARKDLKDDLSGLLFCNKCGQLACQPCNGAPLDAQTSTGSEFDIQNCGACATTAPDGKDAHVKGIDDPPPTIDDKLQLKCAAVLTEQGTAASETDVNDEMPINANSGKPLKCHYCNRVHTKAYFEQLPRLLILQLQRSSPAEITARHASRAAALAFTGGGVKIKAHVQFPLELQETLSPYCSPPNLTVQLLQPVVTKADGEKRRCGGYGDASCTVSDPRGVVSGNNCPSGTSTLPVPLLPTFALPPPSPCHAEALYSVLQGVAVATGAAVHEADTPSTLQTGKKIYKLRAVIEQQGRTRTNGHYVCFRRGFACRRLQKTSEPEPCTSVCAATISCTSTGALAPPFRKFGAAPLLFAANVGGASHVTDEIPAAAANSDQVLSVQAYRPVDPTPLMPPRSVAVDQSSLKVDGREPSDACETACLTQSNKQGTPIARSAQEEKTVETQNRMSSCVVVMDDRNACQQEAQINRKEPSRGNKRPRDETQQTTAFLEEVEHKQRSLASQVSACTGASSSNKRRCTDSARGDSRDRGSPSAGGGEGVVPFLQSAVSSTCAGREGLSGGGPTTAAGVKTDRRRKKGEADPAEENPLEDEDWWEVNDSQVSRTTWQHVSLCQAYLLVYELEEPAHVMCETQYLKASLQAKKSELEERTNRATQRTAEEQRNKKAAKDAGAKPTTSTSRTAHGSCGDKSIKAAAHTSRTGRGRKRERPASTDDKSSACSTSDLEPAKRPKKK